MIIRRLSKIDTRKRGARTRSKAKSEEKGKHKRTEIN